MKCKLLKNGFLTTALSLLSIGLMAQTLPSTSTPPTAAQWTEFTETGRESIDSVTVGSRMPYRVEVPAPPIGLAIEYKWALSWSAVVQSLSLTPTNLVSADSDDFYSASEISLIMPNTPTAPGSFFKHLYQCSLQIWNYSNLSGGGG